MLFQLFWTYLKVGTFTLGGGYAMLPMIQHEVVNRRKWIVAPREKPHPGAAAREPPRESPVIAEMRAFVS